MRHPEIRCLWLAHCLRAGRDELLDDAKTFVGSVGRKKFLDPIYQAALTRPDGVALAREMYRTSKPLYHSMITSWLDAILLEINEVD